MELTQEQIEQILTLVIHARDGLITKGEMASGIEKVVGPMETEVYMAV